MKPIESFDPPLEIDESSRWLNLDDSQIYRPLIRGCAWESIEGGSIYPFPKGTKFKRHIIEDLYMTYEQK